MKTRCPEKECEGEMIYLGIVKRRNLVCDYIALDKCNSCDIRKMYEVVEI